MKKGILFSLLLMSADAFSVEYIQGQVTVLETSYLPSSISLQLSSGNSTCPQGEWLKWKKSEENNKAVYATLMAALASGKKVNFVINDNDTDCVGQYIHLLAD